MIVSAASLRELHRIHEQLSDLRDRLERGPKQINAHTINVTRLEAEAAAAQQHSTAAKVLADQKQLSLKSGEARIEQLKVKLNACGSNREYQALKEQIAADEMANSVLEDEILEALGKIDELTIGVGEAQQMVVKGKEELAKVEAAVAARHDSMVADIQRLEADLKQAEESLPKEVRDNYYQIVRSLGCEALAQVEGDTCGGCYQTLTPNSSNMLQMSQPVFCLSCGRLLYLPEDRSPGMR